MEQSNKKQTEKSCTRKRCVNLDWLEVHAREPIGEPHNAEFFREHGCWVEEREYGTRVYKEMFVIYGSDNLPAIEVRRNPSSTGLKGIHDAEETHIRVINRLCYFDDCAEKFRNWLDFYHYTDIRISRVDVCMDFVRFDFGDEPFRFVKRYVSHKYAKYAGGDISLHGKDRWEGIDLNSLKWGHPKSIVSTKMYNKTMELKDTKTGLFSKPYIRQAWMMCGFIDDVQHVTLQGREVDVWRIEFSICSPKRGWAPLDVNGNPNKKYSLRNTLEMYEGREKLLTIFASLSKNYFRFKKYKEGVRKDRCEDKKLFDFSGIQQTYKLSKDMEVCGVGDRMKQRYNRLVTLLSEFDFSQYDEKTKDACKIVLSALKDYAVQADLTKPFSEQDKMMLRASFVRKVLASQNNPIIVKQMLADVFKVAPNVMDYVCNDTYLNNSAKECITQENDEVCTSGGDS